MGELYERRCRLLPSLGLLRWIDITKWDECGCRLLPSLGLLRYLGCKYNILKGFFVFGPGNSALDLPFAGLSRGFFHLKDFKVYREIFTRIIKFSI